MGLLPLLISSLTRFPGGPSSWAEHFAGVSAFRGAVESRLGEREGPRLPARRRKNGV